MEQTEGAHTSQSFEQVGVGEADDVPWGWTKNLKKLPAFRRLEKFNEKWIYLKLVEKNDMLFHHGDQ